MAGRYRNTALPLFRGVINLRKISHLASENLCANLRQRRRKRRLSVVYVTYRPHVYVRLITFKFFLGHD
jgi:hypothetical protein